GRRRRAFPPPPGPRGGAVARAPRGALRRLRRGAARRPRRERLAGARAPQHLLSALSARAARLARRSGSAVGVAHAVPGPAPAAAAPRLALHVPARRGRDRVAVDAPRRFRPLRAAERSAPLAPPLPARTRG